MSYEEKNSQKSQWNVQLPADTAAWARALIARVNERVGGKQRTGVTELTIVAIEILRAHGDEWVTDLLNRRRQIQVQSEGVSPFEAVQEAVDRLRAKTQQSAKGRKKKGKVVA